MPPTGYDTTPSSWAQPPRVVGTQQQAQQVHDSGQHRAAQQRQRTTDSTATSTRRASPTIQERTRRAHNGYLPLAEELHEEVRGEALVQQLREEVEVGDQRSLQNDGDVRRVEQLDRVSAAVP